MDYRATDLPNSGLEVSTQSEEPTLLTIFKNPGIPSKGPVDYRTTDLPNSGLEISTQSEEPILMPVTLTEKPAGTGTQMEEPLVTEGTHSEQQGHTGKSRNKRQDNKSARSTLKMYWFIAHLAVCG